MVPRKNTTPKKTKCDRLTEREAEHTMKRRNFTSEYKVKLVLEVLREERTLGEIAAARQINPNQLGKWKRDFLERVPGIFDEKRWAREHEKADREAEAEKGRMLKTIGQLTMERDYLKDATEKLADRGLL
jgi:transposase-like protein